ELRNPIAALAGGMHLLKKRVGPEGEAIREQMERQLFHLSRLVDDLLDVARISEGKISLRKERIELKTIIRSAVETSQPNLDAAQHGFNIKVPDEPVWLEADHTRMAQVIANLLNNAAKYTPAGGTITLAAHRDGDCAEIVVADNGLGIPSEMQAAIFD